VSTSRLAGMGLNSQSSPPNGAGREEQRNPREAWERIENVLNAALELSPAERPVFLDRCCADEPELRREIESLLAAHDQAGPLDRPVAEMVEPLLASAPVSLPVRGRTVAHY
jgi:hypothetical protein